jgi:hypothetical protein
MTPIGACHGRSPTAGRGVGDRASAAVQPNLADWPDPRTPAPGVRSHWKDAQWHKPPPVMPTDHGRTRTHG